MTKEDLISAAAHKSGLMKKQVAAGLGALMDAVAEALARGEEVRLQGFGTFRVRRAGPRKARDFKGGTVEIPAGPRIVFRPAAVLRRSVSL
ncbi:MAG: HU family DNA-binding protein [Moorellales bacterium]